MRHYLLLLLLVALPAFASAKAGPVVYVCAHPDDCLLFMSPNLYDDTVNEATKVVVVYLTSGDAGLPFTKDASSTPSSYPYVRELASIDATGWMADIGREPIRAQQKTETVTIRGHAIARVSYANTASYFLRLPDGNMYGGGFDRYHSQSLQKLKNGEISSMSPIDGEAAYTGWNDLVAVLSGIVSRESEGAKNVTVHISDPDIKHNYNDHSDHTTGAGGVMEALRQLISEVQADRCYRIYKHIDYSIAEKQPNLVGEGLQNKAGSFAVLTATQRHFLDHHNWDKAHLSYITRNYFTTTALPDGCDEHP